jgi:hypothetical protein
MELRGAVIVPRGDRRVVAHFASVGAEESVCRKHVGIALRADLDVSLALAGPDVGRAVRFGGEWQARISPECALVIGPPCERPLRTSVISIVGPRAAALLGAVGLPSALAPGDVRTCWWQGAFAVLLCERAERHLLLVDDADSAWQALLDAGRPLEVACVGVDALARLAAVPG